MMLFKDQAPKLLNLRRRAEEAARDVPALFMQAEKTIGSLMHGDHNQRRAGHGLQFWQFREYSPSDRPQDIDWRQSAKTEQVFIRQKERQTPHGALFWCASGPGMDFHSQNRYPAKAEAAKILSLALAILIAESGDQVGILGEQKTGRSARALEQFAQRLMEKTREEALPVTNRLKIMKNATLFLAGDFLSPIEEIELTFKNIASLRGQAVIIQILDPAEIELPYKGRIIFKNPGTAQEYKIESAESVRTAYLQRMRDHQDSLAALCRQLGWLYIMHRTDAPLSITLNRMVQALKMSPHNMRRPS